MKPHPPPHSLLIAHWGIIAAHSLLFTFLILFQVPPWHQPTSSDISISALLMAALPFAAFVTAVYYIVNYFKNQFPGDLIGKNVALNSPGSLQAIALTAIVIALTAVCLPNYYFGLYAVHFLRTQPLMIWIGIAGFQLLLWNVFPQRAQMYKLLKKIFAKNRELIKVSCWFFISFVLIWIFIAVTKLGISGNEDYWYEAGVPILPSQIVISIIIGLLFSRMEKSLLSFFLQKLDLVLFLGIWLIAATVWAGIPAPTSYFNAKPSPPNREIYPSSDAIGYDLQSQYALMGQKLDGGRAIDNPFYPAFLVLIHAVSGQDYTSNMALQAAVLAVLAAIAYLLGKSLFGRTTGITVASMIIFYGCNSIVAASLISLAGPKQMLTDFPTTIGIALVIFTIIIANSSEAQNPGFALWHGGAIGFSFLIRPTSIVLLAVAPLISFFQERSFPKFLRIALFSFLGFVLFITPWGIRNASQHGGAISTYLEKINLVKESRFPETKSEAFDQTDNDANQEDFGAGDPMSLPFTKYGRTAGIVVTHFIHNILASVLILPTSIKFDDLHHTIKSESTVWRPYWDGRLTFAQTITLLGCLVILAMGVARSWQRAGMTGLAALTVFLLYQLANAMGRTSGGRYIVPVEWIVLFYFAAGLIEGLRLISWPLIPREAVPIKRTVPSPKAFWGALVLVFTLGMFPILIELSFSTAETLPREDILDIHSNLQNILERDGYKLDEIATFLEEKNATLLIGQAMYPRYISYRAANRNFEGALLQVNYPHLEFYLMTSKKNRLVMLYQQSLVQLSNKTKVIVLGCREERPNYIDAIAVIIEGSATTVMRESRPPLACPLQKPVCDNNGNCY